MSAEIQKEQSFCRWNLLKETPKRCNEACVVTANAKTFKIWNFAWRRWKRSGITTQSNSLIITSTERGLQLSIAGKALFEGDCHLVQASQQAAIVKQRKWNDVNHAVVGKVTLITPSFYPYTDVISDRNVWNPPIRGKCEMRAVRLEHQQLTTHWTMFIRCLLMSRTVL